MYEMFFKCIWHIQLTAENNEFAESELWSYDQVKCWYDVNQGLTDRLLHSFSIALFFFSFFLIKTQQSKKQP